MTSLLPSSIAPTGASARRAERGRPSAGSTQAPPRPRPLALVATLGGLAAALLSLAVCLVTGLAGWYATDAGAHGTPSDGLRVGALGWLLGHGAGVGIEGVRISLVPLGITLLAALSIWRLALRVGDQISPYGPDVHRIGDGERDWTVPVAITLFTAGYAVVAVITATLAATSATDPSTARVLVWSLALCGAIGAPAIAVASGRAAIWAAHVPETVRGAARACRRILGVWVGVCLVTFALALVLDLSTAANVMSQLGLDSGEATLVGGLSLTVVPNAAVFAGSFLLGPGFSVGTATVVSPSAVVVGPLPMLPVFAALPDPGTPPGWFGALLLVPVLVGAAGAARSQRRHPTLRWREGAVRGGAGGVSAGLVFGLVAALAGGAIGPGRMREVAPFAGEVLVHAVTAFGLGGLLGGLLVTWWQRRAARTLLDARL